MQDSSVPGIPLRRFVAMKRLHCVLAALAVTLCVSALSVPVSHAAPGAVVAGSDQAGTNRKAEISYERYKLGNELEVLLHEDHKLPIVSVDIWYHVGPLKEGAGKTGDRESVV